MPVGHADEKDRLKEDTLLVWPTRHSWNKRNVLSVCSAGTVRKLARVARCSNSSELQAAADAEGELSYIRLSLRELVGETIPLQRWQEAAAQMRSVLVLDSSWSV